MFIIKYVTDELIFDPAHNLEIHKLLNRFNRIGTLVYNDLIPSGIVFDLFPQTFLRLWVIFESYITNMRLDRPFYMHSLEYVAYMNLKMSLGRTLQTESLIFFSKSEGNTKKVIERPGLEEILVRMEKDPIFAAYQKASVQRSGRFRKIIRKMPIPKNPSRQI